MPTTYPLDLISLLFTAVILLGGIVWRALLIRIKALEDSHYVLSFHDLKSDVSVIKSDIEWIKKLFQNKV